MVLTVGFCGLSCHYKLQACRVHRLGLTICFLPLKDLKLGSSCTLGAKYLVIRLHGTNLCLLQFKFRFRGSTTLKILPLSVSLEMVSKVRKHLALLRYNSHCNRLKLSLMMGTPPIRGCPVLPTPTPAPGYP